MDPEIEREIERLTEIEIQKMHRAELARTNQINGANQRQQEEQHANQ